MKLKSNLLHRKIIAKLAVAAFLLTVGCLCATTADAAINSSGDVDPANPATWTSVTPVAVGDNAAGSIGVTNGSSIISGTAEVGNEVNGDGTATISGIGSTWTVDASLFLGDDGEGSMRIENRGTVTAVGIALAWSFGASGDLVVTGVGSYCSSGLMYVGNSGEGTIRVENGGSFASNDVYVGRLSQGVGAVTVTGSGSSWSNTTLYVGTEGQGTLNIENAGIVSTVDAHLSNGGSSSGVATVTGAGSTWTIAEEFEVGSSGTGTLNLANGGKIKIGRNLLIHDTNGTFNWTGGILEINGSSSYLTNENLEIPDGGLLTGTGFYTAGTTQIVKAGGRSQYTGGPLYRSEGAGYTITGGANYTLATATYNILPSGSLRSDNLWKFSAGDNIYSFVTGGPFTLGTNDALDTVGDCVGLNALSFGASTGGTININHEVAIATYNAMGAAAFVVGTDGKLDCASGMDMRNASHVTIDIVGADFLAGRTVADLGNGSWIVDPAKVTLNIAKSGDTGTVVLATSIGAKGMTTDGTTGISQADLDSWISEHGYGYSIGYDGFSLVLDHFYIPPDPGDSNELVVVKLVAGGFIELPPGMAEEDVIASQTTTTGSSHTSIAAAKKFGTTLTSRIGSSAASAGWGARGTMASNDETVRGQQILRDYRRGKTSLWMENVGSWTKQEAIGETITGYNASLLGMQVGIDRMFGRNLLGGLSYGGAWAVSRSGGQKILTNIFDLQLYGAWRVRRNLRCIGSTGYQYMDYNGTFLGENSSHVGNMFKMAGAIEYDIRLGRMLLTPIYGWEYYKTDEDAYETGQFAVEGNSTQAIYQRCGMRVAVVCHPRIKIGLHSAWLRNFGDENIIFSAASGGTPFQLTGAPVHSDLGEVGVDTTIALTGRLDLTLGYLGVYAPGFNTQSVNGLLRYHF